MGYIGNMVSRNGNTGRVVVARLKTGSDLLQSLRMMVKDYDFKAAVILSGVGLLSGAKLRNCKNLPEEFPITDHNRYYASFIRPLEILGLSGNVSLVDGNQHVHAHLTLSYVEDGIIRVIGGHMIEGCTVFGFSEIILMELTDIDMIKSFDEETKTNQLFN
jgi:predicted DNA-binding protein with PD1-like motif